MVCALTVAATGVAQAAESGKIEYSRVTDHGLEGEPNHSFHTDVYCEFKHSDGNEHYLGETGSC